MALTITATKDHYFVDGPETWESDVLNEFLIVLVNLDNLAEGEYTFSLKEGVFTLDPPFEKQNGFWRHIKFPS